MKELKIGEVFLFLGTAFVVCGYNSVEGGVIESLEIWPFRGDPGNTDDINNAIDAREHRVNQ